MKFLLLLMIISLISLFSEIINKLGVASRLFVQSETKNLKTIIKLVHHAK